MLLTLLDGVVTKVTAVYDEFDKIGKDNKLWSQISDRLVNMAKWIHDYLIVPTEDFFNWVHANVDQSSVGTGGQHNYLGGRSGKATGGPVLPNSIYTVGERGPETLVMGTRGGTVIPNADAATPATGAGGSSVINVYVTNPQATAWDIANEVAWAKKTKRI